MGDTRVPNSMPDSISFFRELVPFDFLLVGVHTKPIIYFGFLCILEGSA
jgi:hypothetical protein